MAGFQRTIFPGGRPILRLQLERGRLLVEGYAREAIANGGATRSCAITLSRKSCCDPHGSDRNEQAEPFDFCPLRWLEIGSAL